MTDYAKRLKACKNWKWMPGMVGDEGWVFVRNGRFGDTEGLWINPANDELRWESFWNMTPDLTKATKGCLVAQIREAAGYTGIYMLPPYLLSTDYDPKNEEERILAALEAL